MESLKYLVHYIVAFIFLVVIVSTIDTADKLNLLVKLIAFGTFLTALYGIYQWKVIGVPVDPSTTDLTLNPELAAGSIPPWATRTSTVKCWFSRYHFRRDNTQ